MPRTAAGFNLVLVTLDTVRADRLGCYGGSVETSALDALARAGVRFDQATAAAPLTLPAHATILTGALPPRHGLRDNETGALPADSPALAERLARAGYRTGAFVGSFVLDHRTGLDRGFEVYDDEIEAAERPADIVVDHALAWLERALGGAPYFLWVHLYDAHAPYDPPTPYRERYGDLRYDGEVAFVDSQVGRLLAALERTGESARTVVAVVADHGESLGEHGEQAHGLLLYQSTLRVPLLVRAPGVVPAGRVVAAPVGLVDLAPTLAGLLGAPLDAQAIDGRDLSAFLVTGAEPPPADVYSETEYPRLFGWAGIAALRRGAIKHIAGPRPETFDLSRDPRESTSLGAGALEHLLAHELARIRQGSIATNAALTGERREKLASLGYVGGPPSDAGKVDPKDATAWFYDFEEAHLEIQAGRVEVAAATLERLVREDPTNPVFRRELALTERERGNLD